MRTLKKINFRNGDWWFWLKHRDPLAVLANIFIFGFSMVCFFPEIKNPLLRLTGMKVGNNAFVAVGTALDIFYPELIEIGDNAIIGYGCVITAHELVQGELRIGKIRIGANSVVGTKSVVLPGVDIGDGATVGAMSLVNRDVPSNEVHCGVPARKIR